MAPSHYCSHCWPKSAVLLDEVQHAPIRTGCLLIWAPQRGQLLTIALCCHTCAQGAKVILRIPCPGKWRRRQCEGSARLPCKLRPGLGGCA